MCDLVPTMIIHPKSFDWWFGMVSIYWVANPKSFYAEFVGQGVEVLGSFAHSGSKVSPTSSSLWWRAHPPWKPCTETLYWGSSSQLFWSLCLLPTRLGWWCLSPRSCNREQSATRLLHRFSEQGSGLRCPFSNSMPFRNCNSPTVLAHSFDMYSK